MNNKYKKELAKLLLEKSYKEGLFKLASGKTSDWYFDCRITSLSAKGAFLIGNIFNDMLGNDDIKGVAGMSMGADPLVTATSITSRMRKNGSLDGLYVRKEPKDHGMGKQVEGMDNFQEGDRIAVLEDVVTTGNSLLKAVKALEKCGLVIVKCCAILDREDGGYENITSAGYPFESIFTRQTLLDIGRN